MESTCHSCEHKNPSEQLFCGACGSPLALSNYVAKQVDIRLAEVTREKELVETESAVRVFEKVFSWFQKLAGAVTLVVVVAGFFFSWRAHDLNTAVDEAKRAANRAQLGVTEESKRDIQNVRQVTTLATISAQEAQASLAEHQAAADASGHKMNEQMKAQAASVTKEVQDAHAQIQAASKLEPEMRSIREELGTAKKALLEQQETLANSETYAKKILSQRRLFAFDLNLVAPDRFLIIPPASGSQTSVLLVLLPESAIDQTMQLQQHVTTQPPNSYFMIHNILVFFWGDPVDGLKAKAFTATYFADTTDKIHVNRLEMRDGRPYGDGEPLPKFGQPDSDFKGSMLVPFPVLVQ
jgi:hypothetical protein